MRTLREMWNENRVQTANMWENLSVLERCDIEHAFELGRKAAVEEVRKRATEGEDEILKRVFDDPEFMRVSESSHAKTACRYGIRLALSARHPQPSTWTDGQVEELAEKAYKETNHRSGMADEVKVFYSAFARRLLELSGHSPAKPAEIEPKSAMECAREFYDAVGPNPPPWPVLGDATREHFKKLFTDLSKGLMATVEKPAVLDYEKIAKAAHENMAVGNQAFVRWDNLTDSMRQTATNRCADIFRIAGLAPDPDLIPISRKKAADAWDYLQKNGYKGTMWKELFEGLSLPVPKSTEEKVAELAEKFNRDYFSHKEATAWLVDFERQAAAIRKGEK